MSIDFLTACRKATESTRWSQFRTACAASLLERLESDHRARRLELETHARSYLATRR